MRDLRQLKHVIVGLSLVMASAATATGEPPSRPMTFTSASFGDVDAIVASGEITPETPTAFVNFLTEQGSSEATLLVFSSDGGDLAAGLELGRMVRRLSLSTIVGEPSGMGSADEAIAPSRCASACALAFLGGVRREIPAGSEYGVHQLRMDCVERWRALAGYPWLPVAGVRYCPEFGDAMSAFQAAQGGVAAYLNDMGVDPKLFARMSEVPAMQVSVLSDSELVDFGVVTTLERQQPPEPGDQ